MCTQSKVAKNKKSIQNESWDEALLVFIDGCWMPTFFMMEVMLSEECDEVLRAKRGVGLVS